MKMGGSFTNLPIFGMLRNWKEEGLDEITARSSFYNLVDIIDSDPDSDERVYRYFDITNVIKKCNKNNSDINEFIKLCDFYSECVGIGSNNVLTNINIVNNLSDYSMMSMFDNYAETNSILKNKMNSISLGDVTRRLISEEDDILLKKLFSYLKNFHSHEYFDVSIQNLKIKYERNSKDDMTSYLSKYPGFMQPKSNFKNDGEYSDHHSFDQLQHFLQHYENRIIDQDLQYKLNYDEMILIELTYKFAYNYAQGYHPVTDDIFFQHLNQAISCGETLDEKRQSMTYWCKEVQRMIKSGAYDNELRLMFGSSELVGGCVR